MREEVLDRMKAYFGTDERRINHALMVLAHAEEIAKAEGIEERMVLDTVIYSAILHDIGIHEAERKYNSSIGKYQEIEGPPIAENILSELKIDREIIDRVLYIVGHHHTLNKVDKIDFQILWEADLLVNLEEKDLDSGPDSYSQMSKTFKTEKGKEKLRKLLNS